MSDPTADIKDTFVSESLLEAFDRFETALAEHAKKHPQIKHSSGSMNSGSVECVYKLDTNTAQPAIRMAIAQGDQRSKHEFCADAVGNGILNMRLIWRDRDNNRTFSSEELAEHCLTELMATDTVAR